MRSPVRQAGLEAVARVAASAALAALAVRAALGSSAERAAVFRGAATDSSLAAWTVAPPVGAVVAGPRIPGPVERDWLRALRRDGLRVSWELPDGPAAAAMVAEAEASPAGITSVVMTADSGVSLRLDDDLGRLDTVPIGSTRAATRRLVLAGPVTGSGPAANPIAGPRDSLVLKPVLVLGSADWESRFVAVALEETGWRVEARFSVAPGADVIQGTGGPIDTARFSAVVVLDSSAVIDGSRITRFVSQGGGLVIAGAGSSNRALAALVAGMPVQVLPGIPGGLQGSAPRTGLPLRVPSGRPRTVVLERRGASDAVLARRFGAGRVLQVGYEDSWRWRMAAASSDAPQAHRAWWSTLVAGVALAQPVPRPMEVDEAPLAAMVAAFGPPPQPAQRLSGSASWPVDAVLFLVAMSLLLTEWLSRRWRGRP